MTDFKKPSDVFAQRLQAKRLAEGLTQTELARLATDEGRELNRAAVLRIERRDRGLALDEAVALATLLGAVPAQMLTPPEGERLGLTDKRGVDGAGLRNWFNYGDPVLAMPATVGGDETRAVLRGRLEQDLRVHALALTDAVRGKDKEGIRAAVEAIVRAVKAYQDAIERESFEARG
jgi:transcriptional regulator with XRE-family HTH domain